MYNTSDLISAIFVSVLIAFSVGFSFIGMAMCIKFGIAQIIEGCSKISDKLKNSKES